ncbi:TIR domain-containing protein [Saccharothrix saharensis]|uniref:TIR domain-containing protein n=1 Tax=Saccharothrix saharensis TaxID=571190 RepID=A0A543J631_9PSEU|nr:toll/interleukin-1 receptor domain-containing protein [Saccharothrix saharensis]TQM78289.1 TIR domain-containing protein [Saccharothrix saharensis]
MSGTDFDSFISYSHSGDRPVAKALQRTLQRLGRRWYRPSALRVFRDDTTLAAAPDLWTSIERALRRSRTFVLLASPEASASPWVGKEVALWREERSREDFFLVLTAGELVWDDEAGDFDHERTTALPEAARGWFDAEPLWIDLRGHRERVQRARFRDAAAAVAAAIHGVAKDRLLNEDVRQQRRLVGVLSALLVVALIAGVVAFSQRDAAIGQRDRADEQARIALSRALAAESDVRTATDPQLAAQLALASRAVAETAESGGALLRRLDENRHVLAYPRRGGDQPSTFMHASSGTASRVAITGDGSVVAFAHEGDPEVTLWHVREHREVGRLSTGKPAPELGQTWNGVSFDRTGSVLVASAGTDLVVWDTADRGVVRTIPGVGAVDDFELSPDGRWMAHVDSESDVGLRLRRVDTGEEVSVPRRPVPPSMPMLEFDRDSTHLYVSFPDGIHALHLGTGSWSSAPVVVSEQGRMHAVAHDARQFFLVADGVVQRWHETGARLADVPVAGMTLGTAVDVSADGRTVVATAGRRLVAVDTATGRSTDLVTHRSGAVDFALSGTGDVAVSISMDGDVVVSTPTVDHRSPASTSSTRRILSAAVAARAPVAAFGGKDGIDVVELPSLKTRRQLQTGVWWKEPRMALSPDGRRLAVLEEESVHVFDADTGATIARWPRAWPGAVLDGGVGVAFVGDGTRLLFDSEGGPGLLDVATGEVVQVFPVRESTGGGFVTTPDGRFLALSLRSVSPEVRDGGSVVEIWRWDGNRYVDPVRVSEPAVARALAITEDGTTLGIADIDGRVVLVDLAHPEQRRYLQGEAAYSSMTFTSDGETVVQADCGSGGVISWNVSDGVKGAAWHRGPAPDQATCSDITLLRPVPVINGILGTDAEGGMTLWRLDVAAAADVLCSTNGVLDEVNRARYLRDVIGSVPSDC